MKPPPFVYLDPCQVDEAVALLAAASGDTKVLAGGQSLVPLLNFRLARPDKLIDINGIGALRCLRRQDSVLRIGALVRQASLERSRLVAAGWPLLITVTRFIAHPQIRNRGTIGGSVAHADPAAELPAAFVALDARFHARSTRGVRSIPASDFFRGLFTTALASDELLVEIDVPPMRAATGHGFSEIARRHGDFALTGACALITLTSEHVCREAVVVPLAAASAPIRCRAAEGELVGHRIDETRAAEAGRAAAADSSPVQDRHASASLRRRLIAAMVRRAVLDATQRAIERADAHSFS